MKGCKTQGWKKHKLNLESLDSEKMKVRSKPYIEKLNTIKPSQFLTHGGLVKKRKRHYTHGEPYIVKDK